MPSKPPKVPPPPPPFPPNWDLEDEGAGATREMETDELFALAGLLGEMDAPAMPPVVTPLPPPPPDLVLPPPMFEETQPMSKLPSTIRPAMPQKEYVEHMMRQVPPSDTGMLPLGGGDDDAFGMLTPWPASVPPEKDPASVSNLFELGSEVLSAAPLPAGMEDMTAPGQGFGEVDLDELGPELLGGASARRSTPPPRVSMEELDQLLIDEVMRVRRPSAEMTAPRSGDVLPEERAPDEGVGGGLDVAFDDPLFLPPSETGLTRVLAALEIPLVDPSADQRARSEAELSKPLSFADISPEPAPAESEIEPIPPTYAPDTVQDVGMVAEVAQARHEGTMRARLEQVRARFEVGDFGGALVLAEGMLEEEPKHLAAKCYADCTRAMLRQMYLSRIGDKTGVLKLLMDAEEIRGLQLDHRAGFLLSCVDGLSTIDEILDVSGMPPLDALRILYELLQEGVIEAEPAPPRRSRGERMSRRREG